MKWARPPWCAEGRRIQLLSGTDQRQETTGVRLSCCAGGKRIQLLSGTDQRQEMTGVRLWCAEGKRIQLLSGIEQRQERVQKHAFLCHYYGEDGSCCKWILSASRSEWKIVSGLRVAFRKSKSTFSCCGSRTIRSIRLPDNTSETGKQMQRKWRWVDEAYDITQCWCGKRKHVVHSNRKLIMKLWTSTPIVTFWDQFVKNDCLCIALGVST